MDKYKVFDTKILFYNCDVEINSQNRWDDSLPHYKLFIDTMHELGQLGFCVEKDKNVSELIRKDYYCGRYHDLEFRASRYPAGFEITFFQNINIVNSSGGYYDFDKFEKMPYLQKLIFKKIIYKLSIFFDKHGIKNDTEPFLKTSEEKIKYDFMKSWHHKQSDMNFNLSDLNGTTVEDYNNKDRDKKIIYNGQTKYFRDYKGYLMRGTVYHNINNMWWVIINKDKYYNIASFELFDLTKNDKRGRLARIRIPKSYLDRKAKLSEASINELANELRRRGKLIEVTKII